MADVTRLLARWGQGSPEDDNRLVDAVHGELRKLARDYLRRERPDHTLQPTALINEAYLRLARQRQVRWQSRAHFFGIAAHLMRRILVDHARRRRAAKRGDLSLEPISRVDLAGPGEEAVLNLLSVHEALSELAALDRRQADIVELRYFGGLSVPEIAGLHQLSIATVKRDLATANVWLRHRLQRRQPEGFGR